MKTQPTADATVSANMQRECTLVGHESRVLDSVHVTCEHCRGAGVMPLGIKTALIPAGKHADIGVELGSVPPTVTSVADSSCLHGTLSVGDIITQLTTTRTSTSPLGTVTGVRSSVECSSCTGLNLNTLREGKREKETMHLAFRESPDNKLPHKLAIIESLDDVDTLLELCAEAGLDGVDDAMERGEDDAMAILADPVVALKELLRAHYGGRRCSTPPTVNGAEPEPEGHVLEGVPPEQIRCPVCLGEGLESPWQSSFQAPEAEDDFPCEICYGDSKWGVSAQCQHFYCKAPPATAFRHNSSSVISLTPDVPCRCGLYSWDS